MQRLAGGVTSESHPLYGTFMSQLSTAIFEWDMGDISHLTEAKKGELVSLGVSRPTDAAARKATTKEELLKHCRRRTRGVEETIIAIEQLLLSLSSATDTLGVPLLKQELTTIWAEQKKHIPCIQDPPGITLYTVVGHLYTVVGQRMNSYLLLQFTMILAQNYIYMHDVAKLKLANSKSQSYTGCHSLTDRCDFTTEKIVGGTLPPLLSFAPPPLVSSHGPERKQSYFACKLAVKCKLEKATNRCSPPSGSVKGGVSICYMSVSTFGTSRGGLLVAAHQIPTLSMAHSCPNSQPLR